MVRYTLAALAAAAALGGFTAEALSQSALRIGLALPYEGRYSSLAEGVERGWQMALAEIDGKVAGRKVEIVKIDTKADPETARREVENLLKAKKIDIVAGVINSGVGVALGEVATRYKRPLVVALAIADVVTGRLCSPYVARTSFAAHAYHFAAGRHLAKKGATAVTIGPDHAAGHAFLDAFKAGFIEGGGAVSKQIWTPVGSRVDWNAVLAKAQATKAALIYAFYDGEDALALVRFHARAGLKEKQPLYGGQWLYGAANWGAMGEAADGAQHVVSHLQSLGHPANRRFVDAYRKRFKSGPGFHAYFGYENAKPVLAAAQALKGDTTDGAKFIRTMTRSAYDLPRGELRFNKDNNAIVQQLYLARLERKGERFERHYVEVVPGAEDAPGCTMGRAAARSQAAN